MQHDEKERKVKSVQRGAMYLEVFSTDAGKKVLEDLDGAFHHAPLQSVVAVSDGSVDVNKTMYNVGAREVLEHIHGMMWIAEYPDKYMRREITSPDLTMDEILEQARKDNLNL